MTCANALRHHRFETPFGDWRVSVMDAPADLDPAVAEFWDTSGRFAFAREQLLPRGSLFLVFNLGTRQLRQSRSGGADRLPRAYLWGLQDGPVWTAPDTARSGFDGASVGARLHAGAAAALFGIPGRAFRGRVVALGDILDRDLVERCLERLSGLGDPASRMKCVAAFLRHAGTLNTDPEIDWAVAMIRQSRGGLPIAQIADAAGLSRPALTRRFRDRVGTAPKRYARLVKFFAAVEAIKPEPVVDWAGLAADAGYFDQPHMIRDFREFSGLTPAEFLKERAADGETIIDPG